MKNKQSRQSLKQERPLVQFSKVDRVVALDTVSWLIIQVNMAGTFLMK